jgi:hypothetical protein
MPLYTMIYSTYCILLLSDRFWKGQVKSMKMDIKFKQFERSIDGWNRKRFQSMDAVDYRKRSRFAEFIDQMKNTRT